MNVLHTRKESLEVAHLPNFILIFEEAILDPPMRNADTAQHHFVELYDHTYTSPTSLETIPHNITSCQSSENSSEKQRMLYGEQILDTKTLTETRETLDCDALHLSIQTIPRTLADQP